MSVCIIYASKYGSAKKVAGLISEKLGGCDILTSQRTALTCLNTISS